VRTNWWVRSGRASVMAKKNRSPEAWLFSVEGWAPCSTWSKLELPEIVPGHGIGRAPEERGKRLNMAKIAVLGLLTERADGHVLDHAAAKFADGLSLMARS